MRQSTFELKPEKQSWSRAFYYIRSETVVCSKKQYVCVCSSGVDALVEEHCFVIHQYEQAHIMLQRHI